MKKFIAMLLCLVLVCSMAACAAGTAPTPAEDKETPAQISPEGEKQDAPAEEVPAPAETKAADPFGKYDTPVTLTAVRYLQDGIEFKEGESLENNVWSHAYEDQLGITLQYAWTTPLAQYAQKLNVSIASDDLPDLMWVDAAQLKRMVEDDMLADLTDVYANYAAEFTNKVLTDDGGSAMEAATFGGKLYGLPHIQSGYGSTEVLWVRADWLEKLGLDTPKTMEDVLNAARAFATQDPDGNGVDDTYGIGINKGLLASNNLPYAVLDGFFNAYHAYPTIWVETADGLAYGGVQPEMKNALAELQSLYAEGAIDPEFGVKDAVKVSEDANSGKVGMFYGYFWNCASGWLQDGKVNDPSIDWVAVPISSIDSKPASAMAPFATTYYTVVSKDCEHPEAAVKMYNLVLEKMFGATAEPEVYNATPDNIAVFNYAYSYGKPPLKNLDAQKAVCAALESGDASALNAEQMNYYNGCKEYLETGDLSLWGNYMMYGPTGGLAIINEYVTNGNVVTDKYYGAPTDGMSEYNATLEKLALETFTKIIIGTASIDEFDTYVENWYKLGGQTITDEVNDWLSAR